jgi:hypothetical protein
MAAKSCRFMNRSNACDGRKSIRDDMRLLLAWPRSFAMQHTASSVVRPPSSLVKVPLMSNARIYQYPKNAMQSGRAKTDIWMLEFEPTEAKQPDPLTGWAGSGDTREQVKLRFPTLDAATDYATREGIAFHVVPAPQRKLKLQAYADNFK